LLRLLSIVDTLVSALSIVFAAALRRMWAIPGARSKVSRKAPVWRRVRLETSRTCPASVALTVMASFSSVLEVACGALVWAEGRASEASAKTAALAVERPRELCNSIFAQLSKSTLDSSALACFANIRSTVHRTRISAHSTNEAARNKPVCQLPLPCQSNFDSIERSVFIFVMWGEFVDMEFLISWLEIVFCEHTCAWAYRLFPIRSAVKALEYTHWDCVETLFGRPTSWAVATKIGSYLCLQRMIFGE
jgi:hypothetical protein